MSVINITQRNLAYRRVLSETAELVNDMDDYVGSSPDARYGFERALRLVAGFIRNEMEPAETMKPTIEERKR